MFLKGKSLIKGESGITVVEATIYMPILMLAYFAIIIISFYITQRVVLDSAVTKVCLEAAAYLSDEPKVDAASEFSEKKEALHVNPYVRMLSNAFTYHYDPLFKATFANKVEDKVNRYASLSFIAGRSGVKAIKVTSKYEDHVFFGELIIDAQQEFKLPIDLRLFGVEGAWKFNSTAKSMVFKPASLINDVDFIFDALRWVGFDIKSIKGYVEDLPNKIIGLIGDSIF